MILTSAQIHFIRTIWMHFSPCCDPSGREVGTNRGVGVDIWSWCAELWKESHHRALCTQNNLRCVFDDGAEHGENVRKVLVQEWTTMLAFIKECNICEMGHTVLGGTMVVQYGMIFGKQTSTSSRNCGIDDKPCVRKLGYGRTVFELLFVDAFGINRIWMRKCNYKTNT